MYGGGTSKPTTASTPMHITHIYDDNCKVCAQPRQIGKNNHYCCLIGQDTNTFIFALLHSWQYNTNFQVIAMDTLNVIIIAPNWIDAFPSCLADVMGMETILHLKLNVKMFANHAWPKPTPHRLCHMKELNLSQLSQECEVIVTSQSKKESVLVPWICMVMIWC